MYSGGFDWRQMEARADRLFRLWAVIFAAVVGTTMVVGSYWQ
jgi:heme/copper-type cytochrome/quinol oxidase subunit 4